MSDALVRDEYYWIAPQLITKRKLDKFLSRPYYKILYIPTGEYIYRQLVHGRDLSIPVIPELPSTRKLRLSQERYKQISYFACPIVLSLTGCKAFIRTNIKNGMLQKTYPECSYNEFMYIEVTPDEVTRAYGLTTSL